MPHRHLPLYGVAHQARHKVMHLLGATKQRDKMKRPKPVAPVFDLERLLRTCLKEDRSRVARDNLDLVAYWPPSDKSCRPKCRRFQNDRDLGKNWEDTRACLLADLAQAALGPENPAYRRGIDGQIDKKIRETALQRRWQPVRKSKLYGAFVLNRRVVLHAIFHTGGNRSPRRRRRSLLREGRTLQSNRRSLTPA